MDKKEFKEFGFHSKILENISNTGYLHATPIQALSFPPILEGRDVMGAAQTGTGKTAAFTLPLLNRMIPKASFSTSPAKHPVRMLVLTPTRELAEQISKNVIAYADGLPLRTSLIYGGVDFNAQKLELMRGADIVIATPGRLLDHVEQRTINLNQVEFLILDEADRMLDMGFMPDLLKILAQLPSRRQSLLYSATFSDNIRSLAQKFLHDPVEITVASNNSTASTITQEIFSVSEAEKNAALLYLLASRNFNNVIIFSNRKITCKNLERYLNNLDLSAQSLHGDKTQSERTKALNLFKSAKCNILVATDVAARGLDISDVDAVINYELPPTSEDYVHRIGRTGRAGRKGIAISMYSSDEEESLHEIETLIGTKFRSTKLSIPDMFKINFSSNKRGNLQSIKEEFNKNKFFYQPYVEEEAPLSTQEFNSKKPKFYNKNVPALLRRK
ncbi:putative ATP-dependent RNA helicase [Taylorella asinigenitalis 14/45]|uniref:DEAD-box ATP-dependent RNA helicase RhpA n=1 Tax=Taylorella asinigenitalis 14/45 TaxID=1091495 RepID=I7IKQ7_9BURK|nr:DEAD/DEAH box helicase [Taylorella asinigenitalis]CCG19443.1 putative ATP-dependent RNA helicase [Taylorella asinigenitalis 14/45]